MSENRINVYDEEGKIIGRVRENNNLDYWDGRNFTCGKVGRHEGLTKLKSGEYILICTTQLQGERDHGEIISDEEALQKIMKSNNLELLKFSKFKDLKELYKKTLEDNEDLEEEK